MSAELEAARLRRALANLLGAIKTARARHLVPHAVARQSEAPEGVRREAITENAAALSELVFAIGELHESRDERFEIIDLYLCAVAPDAVRAAAKALGAARPDLPEKQDKP